MRNVLIGCAFILTATGASAEQVIDLTQVAGKSESQVSTYLGKPESCSPSKYGQKCLYEKAETEIVFINGKADWITIEGLDHVPFNAKVLSSLGLKASAPSFSNSSTLRWNSVQGMLEVSVFKGASLSDYAYIKVLTK
jgi:AraC-like DNA-binding protein